MDVLIFDMDGVLIDVSRSYRKAIQRTVQIYLEKCLGLTREQGKLVTDEEISLFKSVGGFNNDWDLTSGLLLYLLSISDLPPSQKRKRFSSIEEVVSHLKMKFAKLCQEKSCRFKKKHLSTFLEEVRSLGGGLMGIRGAIKASWDGWVYQSGDLAQENVVKRIFQEVYLGKKFVSCYHLPPLFYSSQGLYLEERLLIPIKILATLRKKVRMGIASGRPRFEAELALKRFRLLPYFDSMVTLEECMEEEARIFRFTGRKMKCSKPHPYSILRAVQEIGISNPQCGYVGDVVDDMVAAQAAKKELQIFAIGFLTGRGNQESMKKSLFKVGADLVIESPRDLLRLISPSTHLSPFVGEVAYAP